MAEDGAGPAAGKMSESSEPELEGEPEPEPEPELSGRRLLRMKDRP